jgi:5-methylcytosine-specific restriction endonuclease McrA
MQNYVFLLNADKTFLNMIPPARARVLQSKGKAAVFRLYPYILILKEQVEKPILKEYRLKIDPGSKGTGFAIQCGEEIIFLMELKHRGESIKSDLEARAGYRRGRRSRNLRYRKKRFSRNKPDGWLAPSLMHRVHTIESWIKRFLRYCPIVEMDIEQVRFDAQALQNPEICGAEYQRGTLFGYEVRQYLLEKWGRKCAYCGAENVRLEIEHIDPKSKGGSNRVSNLTLACHNCNQAKDNKPIEEFLRHKPDVLKRILSQAKSPLKDAAAVNSTRFAVVKAAKKHSPSVRCWTGGTTKFNRFSQNLIKTHSIDAACVGESGASLVFKTHQTLLVDCKGHGSRQARRNNASGFPVITVKLDQAIGTKVVKTIEPKKNYTHATAGDVVKIVLEKSRKHLSVGTYTGRVKTPTPKGVEIVIQGYRVSVDHKYVQFIHRCDGYAYRFTPVLSNLSQEIATS